MDNKHIPHVKFFKLGGTWDMVKDRGRLIGSGGLDEKYLRQLEESLGYYASGEKDFAKLEFKLSKKVDKYITANSRNELNLVEHLSYVPHISENVKGFFVSLFSGDSSHLRPSIAAPIIVHMLHFANENPSIHILAAQGTDTADIAVLPLLDAYTFDTDLLPILFTGSNRMFTEWNSDAPKNFSDLMQLTHANLPAGAYWVFAEHLYRASDVIKIDPLESRRVENYSTFFAPRKTAQFIKKILEENQMFNLRSGSQASKNHPSQTVTMEKLYKALTSIDIVDLGNQNNIDEDVELILNEKKAVIIAAHSLGNVSNPIRYACVQAAMRGKIVVVVCRTLIGEVSGRYAANLLGVNENELLGKGKLILSGHKLKKNIAKAVVVRALHENLSQQETQDLINAYCESRGLL